jgi:predicted dehydrogenase
MKRPVRAGVVGVGHMGQYHLGVFADLPEVELEGISDIDRNKHRRLARKYKTRGYSDYRRLLDKLDAVSIAVPTELHYKIARDFLEAGVHVLVEKPMTDNLEQARELFDLAERKGLVLHVGHVERFNGAVQELRKIVKEPLLVESRRMGPFTSRNVEDGVILDLMIHDLDIILSLVKSKVRELFAVGSKVFSDREDLANVQLVFENGCLANLTASRSTQHKVRTLAITQKDSYIFLDYTDQDIQVHRGATSQHTLTKEELRYKQESTIERIFVHKENPLKLEIKYFLDCAVNGSTKLVSNKDELYSVQVALEIIDKMKNVHCAPSP